MVEITENIDGLRSLSQLFTSSNFNRIVRDNDLRITNSRLKRHLNNYGKGTYLDIFKSIHTQLLKKYRSEYFYKNALLNKIVLGQHSIRTTTVLNELKIGASCADFVFLNGEVRIYEIKTELDSLSKLHKQIDDYSKFANKVFVVSSNKHSKQLLQDLKNTEIGIIEYTRNNTLRELKEARTSSQLDHTTIFKALRKPEYLKVILDEFGMIPDVPNTRIFTECLRLVKRIEIRRFQALALKQLKQRKLQCPEHLTAAETPKEFRYLCHTLDLDNDEYHNFYSFLSMKF